MGEQWRANVAYGPAGTRVEYEGTLYELIQPHTSQVGWEPSMVPALWRVCRNQQGSGHGPGHGPGPNQFQNNNQQYPQQQQQQQQQQQPFQGGNQGPGNQSFRPSPFGQFQQNQQYGENVFGQKPFGGGGFPFGGGARPPFGGFFPFGGFPGGGQGSGPAQNMMGGNDNYNNNNNYDNNQQNNYGNAGYGGGYGGGYDNGYNGGYNGGNNGGYNGGYNQPPYQWVKYNGSTPDNAIGISNKLNKTFYVARCPIEQGVHPGYFDPKNGRCYSSYGGKEVVSFDFEVLVCDPSRYIWTPCSDPKSFTGNPIIGGYENNGLELYVCKCMHKDVPYFGKTNKEASCAYFGNDGKERKVTQFDILTYK